MQSYSCQIFAGWLIDGSGKPPASKVLITVTDGIIEDIRDAPEGRTHHHPHLPFWDLSGFTLIPPLVDSHVHLCLSGTTDQGIRQFQRNASYSALKPAMEDHLREYLARGIIGIRDGGDYGGYCMKLKMEESRIGAQCLSVKSAGRAWHSKGSYGGLLGRSPKDGDTLKDAITGSAEPFDHIKVINSGLVSLKELGSTGRPQFDFGQLREAFDYAHAMHRKVMVHANGDEPVSVAVEAGCDTIEHGFFAGTENLDRMEKKGVFWIPTLRAMEALAENLPEGSEEKLIALRTLEHQMGQVTCGAEMGVKIALGTDSGSIGVDHGRALAQEIRLFLKAGVSPEKTVHFAASNGALILGRESWTGVIMVGGEARMIALMGSPEMALAGYEDTEKRFFGLHL